MNQIAKLFLYSLKVLNMWFLLIPGRLALFAFIGYNILIYSMFGSIDVNVMRESLGGRESSMYSLFMVFVGIPYFLSFFSMFAMTALSRPGNSINSTLDMAIAYRNGQMQNADSKKAYKIWQQTAHLDVMKANEGTSLGNKITEGFRAEMQNATPQKVYKNFVKK